jgi:hypothetical protein
MGRWYNIAMDQARLWPLTALGVIALGFAVWPIWWMLKRAGRSVSNRPQVPVSGGRYVLALVTSIVAIAVGFAALSLLAMLQSWQAFTKKTHVAEIQCIELAPHQLRVYLVPIERDGTRGATEIYDVEGDQWEVGGDVLRFKSLFTALGVDTVFRLTRVEGRWSAAADANAHKGSAHDRVPPSAAWTALYRGTDRAPLKWMIAGAHGQYVSQLPDRRAVFDLYVTPNGYVVDKRTL